MLVRGVAPHASYGLDALFQTPLPGMTLPGPGSGKLDPVVLAVRQIQAETHGFQKMHRLLALIYKPGASCQDACTGKQGIKKFQLDFRNRVF